jgi:hypothetical protein
MVQSNPASTRSGEGSGGGDYVEGRLLDGFLMLAAGGSPSPEASPDDLVSLNLTSLQIVDVREEDLEHFTHLDRLDLGDNQLNQENVLEQMARLPRLGTLSLACNSICSLTPPSALLRYLRSLDLSYNELHGDVLANLGRLPSLTFLNLSSNCISSVPPEEDLYGLQSLEELVLDANDLVQFIQWRSLDALPRLRKLSLASNRVKRLKDDAVSSGESDEITYFPSLEELDLSSNEIAGVDSIPVVHLFNSLHTLRLSDNPCTMRGPGGTAVPEQTTFPGLPGVVVLSKEGKPWYLQGTKKEGRGRKKEPKIKLNRRKMRRVQTSLPVGRKSTSQLGVLDDKANQLLVSLRGLGTPPVRQSPNLPAGDVPQAELPRGGEELLDGDLSEEEFDRILKQNRQSIDAAFGKEVDEPTSFMRPKLRALALSTGAGRDLGISSRERVPTDESQQQSATGASAVSATTPSGAPRRGSSSSAVFLTGIGDDALDQASGARSRHVSQFSELSAQSVGGTSGTSMELDLVAPGVAASGSAYVTLPPIPPGSRSSSAAGSHRGGAISPGGLVGGNGRSKPPAVPDVSVREAIRALRAASMSEYAVSAS